MRIRTRNVVDFAVSAPSTPAELVNCLGTVSASSPYAAFPSLPLRGTWEKIADEVGSKAVSHPVEHRSVKYDFSSCLSLGTYTATDAAAQGYTRANPSAGSQNFWGRIASLNAVGPSTPYGAFNVDAVGVPAVLRLPPARWDYVPLTSDQESSLKENCFEKAAGLKAEVLQDLVEANQVWPSFTGMAQALPLIQRQWPKLRKAVKNAYTGVYDITEPLAREIAGLRRIVARTSGGYLAYKFGALPLVMDIEAVRSYLPKLEADVKRFAQQKVMRFSSHAELVTRFDDTVTPTFQFGVPVYIMTPKGRALKVPTVRYVLLVRPNQHYMTDFFKKLHVVLSRFAESPANLAWEIIPFSFVADWFVDIRGFLRAADSLMGSLPYDVIGFTRSFSYELVTELEIEKRSSCSSNIVTARGWLGNVEFKHYERYLASVKPDQWLAWKPRFGKNQAAITAALIAQFLFKK